MPLLLFLSRYRLSYVTNVESRIQTKRQPPNCCRLLKRRHRKGREKSSSCTLLSWHHEIDYAPNTSYNVLFHANYIVGTGLAPVRTCVWGKRPLDGGQPSPYEGSLWPAACAPKHAAPTTPEKSPSLVRMIGVCLLEAARAVVRARCMADTKSRSIASITPPPRMILSGL